jgi:hypothetical protein
LEAPSVATKICAPHLACRAVNHLDRLPGIIDKQSLPGRVVLAHRWRQAAAPGGVKVAEAAVAVAIRLPGPILFPHQQQGYAGSSQLGMQTRPVRLWPGRLCTTKRRREQLALQRHVVQFRRHWPRDADNASTPQILGNRITADAQHDRDLVAAVAADMFEAKNFSNLTHWQSLAWHGAPRDH